MCAISCARARSKIATAAAGFALVLALSLAGQTEAVQGDNDWETQKVEILNNGAYTRKIEKNKKTGATRTTTKTATTETVDVDNEDGTGETDTTETNGAVTKNTKQTRTKGKRVTETTESNGGVTTKTTRETWNEAKDGGVLLIEETLYKDGKPIKRITYSSFPDGKFYKSEVPVGPQSRLPGLQDNQVARTRPSEAIRQGDTAGVPRDAGAVAQTEVLDEGTVYATALVEPDMTIEIREPGYALIANATTDVIEEVAVKPGDTLPAESTRSVKFDDGTGFVTQLVPHLPDLQAMVGQTPVLSTSGHDALPILNGSVTMFVGSANPFHSIAIGNEQRSIPPAKVHAEFHKGGETVGSFAQFEGLKADALRSGVRIWTLDASGRWIREGKVPGGVLDGSLRVRFDRPAYRAGEKGTLHIENQGNYQRVMSQSRFGSTQQLLPEEMKIDWSRNLKGPTKVPGDTAAVPFTAIEPGKAGAAVSVPRSRSAGNSKEPTAGESGKRSFSRSIPR